MWSSLCWTLFPVPVRSLHKLHGLDVADREMRPHKASCGHVGTLRTWFALGQFFGPSCKSGAYFLVREPHVCTGVSVFRSSVKNKQLVNTSIFLYTSVTNGMGEPGSARLGPVLHRVCAWRLPSVDSTETRCPVQTLFLHSGDAQRKSHFPVTRNGNEERKAPWLPQPRLRLAAATKVDRAPHTFRARAHSF